MPSFLIPQDLGKMEAMSFVLLVDRVFVCFQDPLLDQLLRLWSLLDLLLKAVGSHVFLETALLGQQRRGSV